MPRTTCTFPFSAKLSVKFIYVLLKHHFCHAGEQDFRKGISAFGRDAVPWELQAKRLHGVFFLPVTVRSVLPRGADWVLPRRHPPLIRRHEGSASHHLPRRATAVKQDVRQGELHFVLLVIVAFLSL